MVSFKSTGGFSNASAGNISDFLGQFEPFPNVRLSSGPSNRDKSIMSWRVPNGTVIKMYINPQNFQISESKQITPIRTKGGYIVQYWGANLTQLTISGTTGSSGIRGINVLRDIYNAENRAFDLVTNSQLNDLQNVLSTSGVDTSNPGQFLPEVAARLRERQFILRPSLASLALSVVMYYQGVQYKGFFTSFNVTESVDNLGMFDYQMTFMSSEQRGVRENFMAWHKEPVADDPAGLLLNGVANAIRRFVGTGEGAPTTFYPSNAPYSFGGNSTAAAFGFDGNQLTRMSIIP